MWYGSDQVRERDGRFVNKDERIDLYADFASDVMGFALAAKGMDDVTLKAAIMDKVARRTAKFIKDMLPALGE